MVPENKSNNNDQKNKGTRTQRPRRSISQHENNEMAISKNHRNHNNWGLFGPCVQIPNVVEKELL